MTVISLFVFILVCGLELMRSLTPHYLFGVVYAISAPLFWDDHRPDPGWQAKLLTSLIITGILPFLFTMLCSSPSRGWCSTPR